MGGWLKAAAAAGWLGLLAVAALTAAPPEVARALLVPAVVSTGPVSESLFQNPERGAQAP